VDAPAHQIAGGDTLDRIPLERFVTDAVTIDLSNRDPHGPIGVAELEPHLEKIRVGDIVLLYSNNARNYGSEAYWTGWSYPDADDAGVAAAWAYIVAGAGSLCHASVIIRFTRRMASAGGVYTYSARGLGPKAGFVAGWLYGWGFAAGISFVMVISGFFLNEVLDVHAGSHPGAEG